MDLKTFQKELFKKAAASGIEQYELYYQRNEEFDINIFEGDIDKYSVNEVFGISFRGLYGGKMGYAFTEAMDDKAIEMLVDGVKMNAEIITKEDHEFIYEGAEQYPEYSGYSQGVRETSSDVKIKMAKDMEQLGFSMDNRVIRVGKCMVGTSEIEQVLFNSNGLTLEHRDNLMYALYAPVVSDDSHTNNAFKVEVVKGNQQLNIKVTVKEAVDKAVAHLGAESVASGQYRILFNNEMAGDLLETFSSIFSAESTQKGLSLLKDKVGEAIGNEWVTIIDDPLMEEGYASRPFDSEGVATKKKSVVEKGVLKTLLHNLKTANKDGVKSTGNASKASYRSTVTVSPSNLYLEPGLLSFDDMLKKLDSGLVITELQGMHSGANPLTGDFSLGAKGFLVKEGVRVQAVDQITIAGNFYKMLESIEAVGADIDFNFSGITSSFGSGSILVAEMAVAGK